MISISFREQFFAIAASQGPDKGTASAVDQARAIIDRPIETSEEVMEALRAIHRCFNPDIRRANRQFTIQIDNLVRDERSRLRCAARTTSDLFQSEVETTVVERKRKATLSFHARRKSEADKKRDRIVDELCMRPHSHVDVALWDTDDFDAEQCLENYKKQLLALGAEKSEIVEIISRVRPALTRRLAIEREQARHIREELEKHDPNAHIFVTNQMWNSDSMTILEIVAHMKQWRHSHAWVDSLMECFSPKDSLGLLVLYEESKKDIERLSEEKKRDLFIFLDSILSWTSESIILKGSVHDIFLSLEQQLEKSQDEESRAIVSKIKEEIGKILQIDAIKRKYGSEDFSNKVPLSFLKHVMSIGNTEKRERIEEKLREKRTCDVIFSLVDCVGPRQLLSQLDNAMDLYVHFGLIGSSSNSVKKSLLKCAFFCGSCGYWFPLFKNLSSERLNQLFGFACILRWKGRALVGGLDRQLIKAVNEVLLFMNNGGTHHSWTMISRNDLLMSCAKFPRVVKNLASMTMGQADLERISAWASLLPHVEGMSDLFFDEKRMDFFKKIPCRNYSDKNAARLLAEALLQVCDGGFPERGSVSPGYVHEVTPYLSEEERARLCCGLSEDGIRENALMCGVLDFRELVALSRFEEMAGDLSLHIFSLETLIDYINSKSVEEVRLWLEGEVEVDGERYRRGLSFNTKSIKTFEQLMPFLSFATQLYLERVGPALYYAAERQNRFEEIVQTTGLWSVPIEPLIRFFSSKPFPEISSWLDMTVSSSFLGEVRRVETLSQGQKEIILRRFRRYDSALPLVHWMKQLDVTEQDARYICANIEQPLSAEEQKWHDGLQAKIDSTDPLSLLLAVAEEKGVDPLDPRLILDLLTTGKETSMCGDRIFITWGNAEESSLCAAQDSTPLLARFDGKPCTVYQKGLFTDISFPVAFATLRRKLRQSETLRRLVARSSHCEPPQCPEEYFEIERIIQHLKERYPQLDRNWRPETIPSMVVDEEQAAMQSVLVGEHERQAVEGRMEVDRGSEISSSFQRVVLKLSEKERYIRARTFLPLLRETYKALTRSDVVGSGYDTNTSSHRYPFTFLSLLLLARSARIKEFEGGVDITLGSNVHFHLKELDPSRYEERIEDNPGFTEDQFRTFCTGYALHTLSPITPSKEVSPKKFCSFVSAIQKLDLLTFYDVCAACRELIHVEDEMCEMGTGDYFSRFVQSLPSEVNLGEDAWQVMCGIADKYLGSVEKSLPQLVAGRAYLFNPRGVGDFCEEEDVPRFILSEGNFASLVSRFFDPCDTQLHDGNCAVNAFLMGINGREAYEGPDYWGRLQNDVRGFRNNVVTYAREHRAELVAEFGAEDVTSLIDNYANSRFEWTGTLAWKCAAGLYGRPIHIYSRMNGGRFSLNEKAEPAPAAVLLPDGEPQGPPINLMQWSVHYCTLFPR